MKWSPITLPARSVALAISVTDSVEVLVARTTPSSTAASRSAKTSLFYIHVLDGGLDDDVGGREVREIRRARDTLADRLGIRRERVLGVEPIEAGVDAVEAVLNVLGFDVAHHHVVAGGCGDLSDPRAHRPRADHAHGFHLG